MDKLAKEIMTAARVRAAYYRPYFTRALYALVFVESPKCPNVAVDQFWRCYYNPDFVKSLHEDGEPVHIAATVLLHEIGHLLRRHFDRAKGMGVTEATHSVAVMAQNMEINDDLQEEALQRKDIVPLPPWCEFPQKFGFAPNDTWENYYTGLMEQVVSGKVKMPPSGGGVEQDGPSGQNGPDPNGQGGKGSNGKGHGNGQQQQSNGNGYHKHGTSCGSGASGVEQAWDLGHPSRSDVAGLDNADSEDLRRQVAEKIREQAKNRGTVPGNWVEWANDVLKPVRVPWDVLLAGAVRRAVTDTSGLVFHSYVRPSRRQHSVPDIVLPCLRRPLPVIAFIGDTSGSMDSQTAIPLVRGTVESIAMSLGARVDFIATDADVHEGIQRVHAGRGVKIAGRGGTDMRVGIDYAIKNCRPKPDVIVVGTDCETPWPEEQTPCKLVVAAITASDHAIKHVPTWATVVKIEQEDIDDMRTRNKP